MGIVGIFHSAFNIWILQNIDIKMTTAKDILNILNIPVTPGRMDCAMITLKAIKNALKK